MKPIDILNGNHDIHMHSRNFSDGFHEVKEVTRFAARWQENPRWVGLSDHNPWNNDHLGEYYHQTAEFGQHLAQQDGIDLLIGMELDCSEEGSAIVDLDTSSLNYILAAYHGGKMTESSQAEHYFLQCAGQPFCDIAAHPDRFLGSVDCSEIDWEKIFNHFSQNHVLCEYNLTTPLRKEVFDTAVGNTDLRFTIASDTHDFHDLANTRIVNAWSESLAGNFSGGLDFLHSLLIMECSSAQVNELENLFKTEAALHRLQYRLCISSFDPATGQSGLTSDESKLHEVLLKIPECDLDKSFLLSRFERFVHIDQSRIATMTYKDDFMDAIIKGREYRED